MPRRFTDTGDIWTLVSPGHWCLVASGPPVPPSPRRRRCSAAITVLCRRSAPRKIAYARPRGSVSSADRSNHPTNLVSLVVVVTWSIVQCPASPLPPSISPACNINCARRRSLNSSWRRIRSGRLSLRQHPPGVRASSRTRRSNVAPRRRRRKFQTRSACGTCARRRDE